jgi:hypothetical protein
VTGIAKLGQVVGKQLIVPAITGAVGRQIIRQAAKAAVTQGLNKAAGNRPGIGFSFSLNPQNPQPALPPVRLPVKTVKK